jgi:hypothetical protein
MPSNSPPPPNSNLYLRDRSRDRGLSESVSAVGAARLDLGWFLFAFPYGPFLSSMRGARYSTKAVLTSLGFGLGLSSSPRVRSLDRVLPLLGGGSRESSLSESE